MGIAKGLMASFLLQLAFALTILNLIVRARKGLKLPKIRRVAGLDAMDEAIGRATEMGRPVFYSPGIGDLQNAQTLASFAVLGHVAKTCARYDTRLLVGNRNATVQPITEEVVREAHLSVGKPDKYDATNIQFLSDQQWGYASGVQGIMKREQVAASVMVGAFWAESLLFAEVGQQLGAIQVAGTANTHQIPFFVSACDYSLIGEEIYAASAYLSKDPVLVGNLIGLDLGKMFAAVLILVGALLATVGNQTLSKLMLQ
ncbi:MAG: DUF6754 domain-containing protein [Bacillota bacterium]